ncbi:family 16 glycosylhydrolase [Ferrimonas balearica]|uniref:glycoside hydrolase family 16 protein n=1 Tax=Ferrimonas balearica TaxID=44012 RepID=UPI001C992DE8|nr:glycoside hydrolase family 16 protein [Ferrimonas balearica]MBY5991024.1 glycoside hydrolase family 16 protein [Ferrimonas balearica]
MNTPLKGAVLTALMLLACPAAQAQYQLVWSDEFDGTALDTSKWTPQLGDGCDLNLCGWGNQERQFYQAENLTVADGLLTITAHRGGPGEAEYSSGRIRSLHNGDFRYGRIEARIQLPAGQGLWPAFWMLPSEEVYGGWAASGEIDIMEAVNLGGRGGNEVHGTLHYGGPWPDNRYSGAPHTPAESVVTGFRVYRVDWTQGEIRWYVDDVLYQTQTQWHSTAAPYPAPFDQPFHLLLNLAVGGTWPGAPAPDTPFPAQMRVDYVRVYQDPAISGGP